MKDIATTATKHQNNVLLEYLFSSFFIVFFIFLLWQYYYCYFTHIRYESALLLNKQFSVPVFPVFLAEIKSESDFEPFAFDHSFTSDPHKRDTSSQKFINNLRYFTPLPSPLTPHPSPLPPHPSPLPHPPYFPFSSFYFYLFHYNGFSLYLFHQR
jgi:hypothetical protein